MKIKTIIEELEKMAPPATAEEWDNPGILAGDINDTASKLVVALDVTPGAIAAAKAVGADWIITHHPVLFDPIRKLCRQDLLYQLAAAGIGTYAAHTNMDKAPGGVNDTLAQMFGLTDVKLLPDGCGRYGKLPAPVDAEALAKTVAKTLGTAVRINGGGMISTLAVCGGSGGPFIPDVAGLADAYLTGEVKHSQWLTAGRLGLTVLEAGHYATEVPIVDTVCRVLQEKFPSLPIIPYYEEAPYHTVE